MVRGDPPLWPPKMGDFRVVWVFGLNYLEYIWTPHLERFWSIWPTIWAPVTSDVSNRLDINAYRSEEKPSDNHIPSFPVELNVSLTQLNTTPQVDYNNDSLNIPGNANLDLSITEYLGDKVHLSLQAGHSG